MIIRVLSLALLLSLSDVVSAQNDVLTTFILIRHAEKEGQNAMASSNKDPKLSVEGLKRAEKLVTLFTNSEISAIYSTPFIRTKSTVEPLAQSKSLSVLEYTPQKLDQIDKMLSDHSGKTIVVCGHSNTIPKIANYLTRSERFKDFDDSDYGNILIVTVSSDQKNSTVTWLRY